MRHVCLRTARRLRLEMPEWHMRFLPYLDDIVQDEPGAPAELVEGGFELDVVERARARIRCPGSARSGVRRGAEIDFFRDRLSAVSAGG